MGVPARFAALSFQDKRLVVVTVVLLVFFKIALPIFRLRRLLSLTGRVVHRPKGTETTAPPSADRVVWAVQAVTRRVPFLDNCLVAALAARLLLAMKGYSSTLRIGVAKGDGGGLAAHAWLELEGGMLFDSSGRNSFTPLPRFDGEYR